MLRSCVKVVCGGVARCVVRLRSVSEGGECVESLAYRQVTVYVSAAP